MIKNLVNYIKDVNFRINYINNFNRSSVNLCLNLFTENYKYNIVTCYEALGEIDVAIKMLEEIKELGFEIQELDKSNHTDTLQGKTFVITGTLSNPRTYFEDLINYLNLLFYKQ